MGMVLDVLRGSQNAAVFEKGYQHIKTYAAVKDISWRDLHQYIIQLINRGVLEIRFHENGRLLLTPLAKSILFEGKQVRLATLIQAKTEIKKIGFTKTEKKTLFEKLRKLRSNIALEENVPAYIIFSDASLTDMEEKLPFSEEKFAQISGVGQAKQEKYARRFLKVIAAHQQSLQPKIPTHEQSFSLHKKDLTPEEIAEQRFMQTETIYGHLLKAHQLGEAIDLHQFITSEEIKTIEKARKTLEEAEGLRPYFDHFQEQVPYWKIKFGLYFLEQK